jgi:hypothetical protein
MAFAGREKIHCPTFLPLAREEIGHHKSVLKNYEPYIETICYRFGMWYFGFLVIWFDQTSGKVAYLIAVRVFAASWWSGSAPDIERPYMKTPPRLSALLLALHFLLPFSVRSLCSSVSYKFNNICVLKIKERDS